MKASVAILAYNHEEFITSAIESALTQRTRFPYEIVIGEDCSADRTREIVLDFQKRYPGKIRVLLQEKNRGAKQNFAETLQSCRGEYIAYLDGDDYWTVADKLQLQVAYLDAHPECSFCFHSVKRIYEDGSFDFFFPLGKREVYTIKDLLRSSSFIHGSSVVVRKGLFGEFPSWFFSENVKIGDWTFYVLNALHGPIGFNDRIMATYRKHTSAIWSYKEPLEKIIWDLETRDYVNACLTHYYDNSAEKRTAFHRYLKKASQYEQDGDKKSAKKSIMKCIFSQPFHQAYSKTYLMGVVVKLYLPWLVPHLVSLKSKMMDL